MDRLAKFWNDLSWTLQLEAPLIIALTIAVTAIFHLFFWFLLRTSETAGSLRRGAKVFIEGKIFWKSVDYIWLVAAIIAAQSFFDEQRVEHLTERMVQLEKRIYDATDIKRQDPVLGVEFKSITDLSNGEYKIDVLEALVDEKVLRKSVYFLNIKCGVAKSDLDKIESEACELLRHLQIIRSSLANPGRDYQERVSQFVQFASAVEVTGQENIMSEIASRLRGVWDHVEYYGNRHASLKSDKDKLTQKWSLRIRDLWAWILVFVVAIRLTKVTAEIRLESESTRAK